MGARVGVAFLVEDGAIADRRHEGTRDDRADARHGHQGLATLILFLNFPVSR
jgi:hypothetical protein